MQAPHYALTRGSRTAPVTTTCAVVSTSAAPDWKSESPSYADLLKKCALKGKALCVKVRAKEARSRGADHYLYITSDLSFYEMPAIERYLAKRGYRAEYRGCAPCGSPYCRVMHTTIAVFW